MSDSVQHGTAGQKAPFGLSTANVAFRSQLVAYPYFVVAAVLFFLQIIFGLTMAAQYVWPTFLVDSFAFNVGRATHLNLLVFWLLIALMGASYYLIPDETRSELFSVRLAYAQLGVLLIAGLGTLFFFWFLHDMQGKPFTESPMPWPLFIALGAVIFLVNVGLTIVRSRHWTAVSVILFAGMAGMSVLYLIVLVPFPNLTVDYFWWWWIIHLWVEGTWEMIAAAIAGYLLLKVTGVERSRIYRWLYLEVGLTLFTGIVGIGHHYYWIGTPDYWLWWGAVFSAFEPLPIALMAYDALHSMRQRKAESTNRVAAYWIGGSAVGHFVGAGVWGFAMTLPMINQWTHGTLVTASHGHFAFFGAFATLALGAMYYMLPQMKGMRSLHATRGMWAFWLMVCGMLAMVASFTAAGVVQTYLNRVVGLDFMIVRSQYLNFWMLLVFVFGSTLFLPGVAVFLWDFFAGREAAQPEVREAPSQAKPA